jgi:TolB-like protein/Tfp pilus assembly protein PilF
MPFDSRRLKERKLVQWALAYLAGAWVLLQVLGLVADAFDWSPLVLRLAFVVFGVGFLAALVLAWFHGERGRQRLSGPELLLLCILLGAAGVGVEVVRRSATRASASSATVSRSDEVSRGGVERDSMATVAPGAVASAQQSAVAVLPFVNMSSDPENEYFSDGITEELISDLSQVAGLRVASRTSAFTFKGRTVDVQEVGRRLNVGAIVEGSVRKEGSRLRITAQLVDAANGFHLWSEAYDRELKDVFAIQEEISRAIVDALKIRLTAGDGGLRATHRTSDPEVYSHYLRGRYLWNQRKEAALRNAIEEFEAALAIDPGFAAAQAGLADAYVVLPVFSSIAMAEVIPKAKAAVLRALELDPGLAEAHATLGTIKTYYDWDWAGAEREYRTAIELNPSYASAHQWLSEHLQITGRFDEALAEARQAQSLDPLSPVIGLVLGSALVHVGDLTGALDAFHAALELDPNFGDLYTDIGTLYLSQRKYPEAIGALERAAAYTRSPTARGKLGFALAAAERTEEARAILRSLEQERRTDFIPASSIAMVHLGLGEKGLALDWLEKSRDDHDWEMPWLKVESIWETLRGEPRYRRILETMGLDNPTAADLAPDPGPS